MKFYSLDDTEHATVLAALRYYQLAEMGDPANRPDIVHELAAPDHVMSSLDEAGIEALFERLSAVVPQGELENAFTDLIENAPLDFWGTGGQAGAKREEKAWDRRVERLRAAISAPSAKGMRSLQMEELWAHVRTCAEGSDWKRDESETLPQWAWRKLRRDGGSRP